MFKHAETRKKLYIHTHGCLCKIIIPTILTISITSPSYSDISKETTNATCDNTTLGTTSGESTLSAQWTANEINLTWYNGETEFATNTCTYDGGITLPSNEPTRTGYNFAGWQVKQALFDLRTLDASIKGTRYGYTRLNGNTGFKEANYGLTKGSGEWATEFSYGTVKGIARCSTQHPTTFWYNNDNIFTPDHFASSLEDETGQSGAGYCWCQASGYDAEKDGTYMNVSSPSWVFIFDDDAGTCAGYCAVNCANYVNTYSFFRSAVFGVSNN